MFTGIIEQVAQIDEIQKEDSNVHFWIKSTLTDTLKIDQSVAHNGVCLTVVALDEQRYKVTAVAETLKKTNLKQWTNGMYINLERALILGDRLDGHIVQGHVDTVGLCIHKEAQNGSTLFRFQINEQYAGLIIEKGSICINGVSLTVFDISKTEFSVTIIPFTLVHTNFQYLKKGDQVNIEFDVLAKYFLRNQLLH